MLFRLDRFFAIVRSPPHCYNFDNLVMRPTVKLNVCLKTYTHTYARVHTHTQVLSHKNPAVCSKFFDVSRPTIVPFEKEIADEKMFPDHMTFLFEEFSRGGYSF